MKCELCGERDATVHAVEIHDGERTERWLCLECAEREGLVSAAFSPSEGGGMTELLGGLLDAAEDDPPAADGGTAVCPGCGHSLFRVRRTALLGCPRCYDAFREELREMLRRRHGRAGHQGRLPTALGPAAALRREISRLKADQDDAVAREDYEQAASLRDGIRELQDRIRREEESAPGGEEA